MKEDMKLGCVAEKDAEKKAEMEIDDLQLQSPSVQVYQQTAYECFLCAHLTPRCHGTMKRGKPHTVFGIDPGP